MSLVFGTVMYVSADNDEPGEDTASFAALADPDETINVLFIGNSYTNRNNLPALFERFCDNAGLNVDATMYAIDSATLYYMTRLSSVKKEIQSGKYDIIIFQEQSDTVLEVLKTYAEKPDKSDVAPSEAPNGDGDAQEKAKESKIPVNDSVTAIMNAMKLAPEDTQFWLYETMSYRGYPEEQKDYTAAYELIAEKTGASILPAGRAFWEFSEKYPNITMFTDYQHPSLTGSQIVAKCMYETLWDILSVDRRLVLKNTELDLLATQIMPLDVRSADDVMKTFESEDPNVATVDENGLVTAVGYGTTNINITDELGNSAVCVVNVSFRDIIKGVTASSVYNPVIWGVEHGIVVGFNKGEYFGPDLSCTRGQFVTFLWRLAGRPGPGEGDKVFSDVTEDMSAYKAITWAVNNGVIVGYPDGTFRPNNTVTRRQSAVMLWRWHGKPDPESMQSRFSDMDTSDSAYKAVLWGEESGVIKGSNGMFMPDDDCLRRHIVTFMYRYAREFLDMVP